MILAGWLASVENEVSAVRAGRIVLQVPEAEETLDAALLAQNSGERFPSQGGWCSSLVPVDPVSGTVSRQLQQQELYQFESRRIATGHVGKRRDDLSQR
jgi:hypothetical protein